MNIIQIQDRLKDFSEQQLVNEMQMPTGSAPQYLVLSELERRKKVKQSFDAQQGTEPTVAEEAVMSRMMPAQMTAQAGMGLPNTAQQPIRMQRGGLPLGLRQNNPGNLESGAGFIGSTGDEGRYDTFNDPIFGIRGISRLADTYATKYGIDTPREFLSRYAPRSDNEDSYDNYLKQISGDLGIDPDTEIDFTDPEVKKALIPSIIGFEQGSEYKDYYSPELIDAGIRATKLQDADQIKELGFTTADYEKAGIPLVASANLYGLGSQSPTTDSGLLLGGRRTPGQGADERDLRAAEEEEAREKNKLIGRGMFAQRAEAASKVRSPLDQITPVEEGQVVPELFKKPENIDLNDPVDRKRFIGAGVDAEDVARLSDKEFEDVERESETVTRKDDPALSIMMPRDETASDPSDDPKPDPTASLYDTLRELAQKRVTSAEEDAEFNKYLALAQMGAALAQSDRGFVGAIGEGIEAGLPALAATRAPLREAEEGILDTELDIAKLEADKAVKPDVLTRKQRLDLANNYTTRIVEINKLLAKERELGRTPNPRQIEELEALKQQLFMIRESVGGIPGLNIPTDADANLAMLGSN